MEKEIEIYLATNVELFFVCINFWLADFFMEKGDVFFFEVGLRFSFRVKSFLRHTSLEAW